MRYAMKCLGVVAIGLGLLIALFPVLSVSRLSGQALNELPDLAATEFSDDRHRFALLDSDFVLGTRTYEAVPPAAVESALRASGFESTGARGERWLSKPCCGEYDAVWVQVTNSDGAGSVVTVTAADTDVQAAWPFFAAVGLVLAAGGFIAVAWPRNQLDRREATAPGPPRSPTDAAKPAATSAVNL